MRSHSIKPQDILILLKILTWQNRQDWRSVDLAHELGLSTFEISIGLERCRRSGFLDPSKRKLMKSSLLEFLVHGLKYVFPAEPGPIQRGMPTAHCAPPIIGKIVSSEQDKYVWPFDEGKVRGQSVCPIYETAPLASHRDPQLYELLVLVDALRIGRTREKNMAEKELKKRLDS